MFDKTQVDALSASLSKSNIKKNPKGFDYVEGWHAIAEANRIFGFDGWDRQTIDMRQLGEPEQVNGNWRVAYHCRVRISVRAGDTIVTRDGSGYGSGIVKDIRDAHEGAIKEAETDAMKRALMTFGNPFGLALYDKAQANVSSEPDGKSLFIDGCRKSIASFRDADVLTQWWNSDAQKQQRRDFSLDANEVNELKNLVIAKRDQLVPKAA